jgi:hypothetical protein
MYVHQRATEPLLRWASQMTCPPEKVGEAVDTHRAYPDSPGNDHKLEVACDDEDNREGRDYGLVQQAEGHRPWEVGRRLLPVRCWLSRKVCLSRVSRVFYRTGDEQLGQVGNLLRAWDRLPVSPKIEHPISTKQHILRRTTSCAHILISASRSSSCLDGPPGTGKTTQDFLQVGQTRALISTSY